MATTKTTAKTAEQPAVKKTATRPTRKRTQPAQKQALKPQEIATDAVLDLDFEKEAATIVTVTPETAQAWLERNVHNRVLMARNVNQIAEDIARGDYRFSGDTIVFSREGVLLDGQHRLAAVVKSGKPLKIVAVTGVEPSVQGNMDSGKTRTLAHALRLRGEVAESALGAVLIAVQAWERGERNHDGNKGTVSKSTSIRFLDDHPQLRDITREAGNIAPRIPGLTVKQVGMLIWALDKLSVDDRRDFFEKLATGAGLEKGSPILTLRNYLARDAASEKRVSPYHRLAVTAKAWNAYREGRELDSLRFRPGGSKPEDFPEPI